MLTKEQQRTLLIAAVLAMGTVMLYWPVAGFDFINLDDSLYVTGNEHLKSGFSWQGLRWCFQIGYAGYWHPLTWLSHMLDCQLFGLRPGPPHIVNVLIHAANSALLFLVLNRMTGTFWRSAMVAALFAWHPLRVESVAWIAERKDVLCALFWMLALLAYVRYTENLKWQRAGWKFYYGLTLLLFTLGLMAKPMIVTLPCVLLLIDWWPLRRYSPGEPKSFSRLVVEKLPFFILCAASSILTVIAQTRGGAVASLEFVPFATRASNAVVGYLRYLGKLFWPTNLSVIYPLTFKFDALEVVLAASILALIMVIAVASWKSRPYWLVGWLWFLGSLFPVIGFVQAGGQSMADRFSYIPSVGIFIIVCWTAHDLTAQWLNRRVLLLAGVAVTLSACVIQTDAQIGYWRNSGTLFQHSLAIDPNNYIALGCYGCYLRDIGQLNQAQNDFQRAIEISPIYMVGYTFLSGVLEAKGKTGDAMRVLEDSLKIRPDFSEARCEIAKLFFAENRYPEAQHELEEGLKLDSDDTGLHLYLGYSLAGQHNYVDAEEQFALSASLAPDDPASHYQWALALAAQHEYRQATAQYRATLRIDPDFANALNNLAWILAANPDAQERNSSEAIQLASHACALTHTNDAIKIETLANSCTSAGRFDEAVAWSQKASEVALAHGQTNIAEQNLELQKLFKSRRAYFDY